MLENICIPLCKSRVLTNKDSGMTRLVLLQDDETNMQSIILLELFTRDNKH